ncbi:hypothetical protein SAMN03097699_1777 [Flavobacteriaceae bacterium MAR_2010_188]|nr:hypothetical protein SAMN03097699_1777 [Flavobacteriaceae bacterium MAR_2010_188]
MDKSTVCPVCDSDIHGRRDKRFCSGKCKSIYHYQLRQKQDEFYLEVERRLKANRRILKRFNHKGYTTASKSDVLAEGFDPNYFTHYGKNGKGDVYLFVFDYGYLELKKPGKRKYLIVEWQAYMSR